MAKTLMIVDLARMTGTKVNTIRFYEEVGLLPTPARTASGRRTYGTGDLRRLTFIRHARALGFGTGVIRFQLQLTQDPERDCNQVREIAKHHLADVQQRIERLKSLQVGLSQMIAACGHDRVVADCGIMEVLSEWPADGRLS